MRRMTAASSTATAFSPLLRLALISSSPSLFPRYRRRAHCVAHLRLRWRRRHAPANGLHRRLSFPPLLLLLVHTDKEATPESGHCPAPPGIWAFPSKPLLTRKPRNPLNVASFNGLRNAHRILHFFKLQFTARMKKPTTSAVIGIK
nr:hypothetical protein Iba_chr07fCG6560 [Ipomoea batatas]